MRVPRRQRAAAAVVGARCAARCGPARNDKAPVRLRPRGFMVRGSIAHSVGRAPHCGNTLNQIISLHATAQWDQAARPHDPPSRGAWWLAPIVAQAKIDCSYATHDALQDCSLERHECHSAW